MAKPTKQDPIDKHFSWMLKPPPDVVSYFQQEWLQLNAEDAMAKKKENERE